MAAAFLILAWRDPFEGVNYRLSANRLGPGPETEYFLEKYDKLSTTWEEAGLNGRGVAYALANFVFGVQCVNPAAPFGNTRPGEPVEVPDARAFSELE